MQWLYDNALLPLLEAFRAYTVPILAVACIPMVGLLLWLLRDRLNLSLKQMMGLTISFVVFGMASIIVFGMIHDFKVFPESTFQHQGLIFFMPLWFYAVAKLLRRNWQDVFDVFAVVLPFVVAGVRLYCIAQGCCFGLSFFHTMAHWPVREITIILNIVIGIISYLWIRKEHVPGIMLPTYMMLYSLIRFEEVTLWGDIYRDRYYLDRGLALFSFFIGFCLFVKLKCNIKKKRRSGRR